MKSIFSFLLLTTFCLLPFVAFSSTCTCDNPIFLPTTTDDDNGFPLLELPEVLDSNGEPLRVGQEYRILSATWGAGSGAVGLAKIGNAKCPNAVVLHQRIQLGLPVKFFTRHPGPPPLNVIRETNQINVKVLIPNTQHCDNENFWMVGKPDMTAQGLRFVVTSRVPKVPDGVFQIEKFTKTSPFYKIRHCPNRFTCSDVGLTSHSGHSRLALTNQPFFFIFKKVQKSSTDA
ncbi:cysteine protease inhibitor 8-like [Lycium ferocissimum]|uniref:cysteine protease inhibitor 8-like n=1 Tax=Lycium ferocissimum TaxID=112874 RepID=UPI0028169A25|nr:cysteine protease inhibitor 8-like [Lycium ferocissimum]